MTVEQRRRSFHCDVVVARCILMILALIFSELRNWSESLPWLYVELNTMLVVALVQDPLAVSTTAPELALAAPTLTIGFLLLVHVALSLRQRSPLSFDGNVLVYRGTTL